MSNFMSNCCLWSTAGVTRANSDGFLGLVGNRKLCSGTLALVGTRARTPSGPTTSSSPSSAGEEEESLTPSLSFFSMANWIVLTWSRPLCSSSETRLFSCCMLSTSPWNLPAL
uniref:Uncharacterized protein n=1 Tax=Triticum urartu TaxID=4572 RepID=A0A8R7Q0H7_TRIUA